MAGEPLILRGRHYLNALPTLAAACRFMGLNGGKSKMRWSPLSLAMGSVLLLLAACVRPQSAPNPETLAAASSQLIQVERRYDFRIDFSDANYNGGKPDTGKLLLNRRKDAEDYSVFWNFDNQRVWDGVALPTGGFLGMAIHWFPAEYPRFEDTLGLAIYRIEGGRLIGTVVEELRAERQRFPETLVGPSSLNGRFEIESGGASLRQGYVKITPKESGYLIARVGEHPVMTGVGLRVGNTLIVSYGSRMSPSVAYFCRADAGLRGLVLDLVLAVHSAVLANPEQSSLGDADQACLSLLDAINLQ